MQTVGKMVWAVLIGAALFASVFASCDLFGKEDEPPPNTYTIVYDANGGSGKMNDSVFLCDAAFQYLSRNTFSRSNYGFSGWATSPSGTVEYTNEQQVNNLAKAGETVTLYAVWKAGTYTVRYNANGGYREMADSVFTYDTEHNLSPNAFINWGSAFVGWAISPSGPVVCTDGQSVINIIETVGSSTLYAVWRLFDYTVIYNWNGGGGIYMSASYFDIDVPQNLKTNTFTRVGHLFMGWAESPDGPALYSDEQNVVNLTMTRGETVTLYAAWKANTYTVVYDRNGGDSGSMANSTFTLDEPQKLQRATFKLDGYVFAGWALSPDGPVVYVDEESVTNLSETAEVEVTLYAVWELLANARFISYDANGGSGDMEDSIFIIYRQQKLRANAFTRTYYTFMGWAETPDGAVKYTNEQNISLTTTAEPRITLYAVWRGFDYTVRYERNTGGGYIPDSPFVYGEAQNLRANTFTRTNYTFMGWASSSYGAVEYANEQSVINLTETAGAVVTLYAVWGANYTVVYNANGGDGEMANSAGISGVAHNLRANAFTRAGYTFEGWAGTSGGAVLYADGSVINRTASAGSTVTLYAQWSGINYTVRYDKNGGDGSMADSAFTYGTAQNLRSNGFNRAGYAFIGWAESSGGAVKYTNGQSVSNLTETAGAVVTLFAVWTDTYTVRYNRNGGSVSGTMADSVFTFNQSYNLPPNTFTNSGYTFQGWAETSDGPVVYTNGQSVSNLAAVGETKTLYAKWLGYTYTVRYDGNGATGGSMANSTFTNGEQNQLRSIGYEKGQRYVFDGWATSPDGAAVYTNGQYVNNLPGSASGVVITLYATWRYIPTFIEQLNALATVPVGSTTTIEVTGNETIAPWTLSRNITVTLKGVGAVRTISLSSNGALFTLGGNVTLILENVILQGLSGNNSPLVRVNSGGTLVMRNGSRITGNTSSSTSLYGGGAYVDGTLTMDGGTISGNTASASGGGGAYVTGTLNLNSGTISGNTATNGGGVYVNFGGSLAMSGGTISGNTATNNGGGVWVGYTIGNSVRGYFTMSGGTISGNTATTYGGGVYAMGGTSTYFSKTGGTIYGYTSGDANSNRASQGGSAAYVSASTGISPVKSRASTAGPSVSMSYTSGTASGGWD